MDGLMSQLNGVTKNFDPIDKINSIIKELANNLVFPSLNNKRLVDILTKNEEDLVDFIKNNSILSDIDDIIFILESKYRDVKGYSVEDRDITKIYDAVFNEGFFFNGKLTMFSGGTGSNRLTKGLLEMGADITLLVNAYDDGKSTGHIRRNLNLLGPSDIAKNIVALMGDSKQELRSFLEYRLPITKTSEQLRSDLRLAITDHEKSGLINDFLNKTDVSIKTQLRVFLTEFERAISTWETKYNQVYDLRDYGIRNMIYVGAHFHYNKDYHFTNNKLIEFFGLSGKIFLNNQEPLWLIAVTEKGNLLNCEAEVVFDHLNEEISEIFLVKKPLGDADIRQFNLLPSINDKINYIKSNFAVYPEATEEAIDSIKQSELIIFPPTTFHSSLTPTLVTKGISEALNNSNSLKIFVANLIRERGFHTLGENLVELEKYINHETNNGQKTEIDYIIINTHGYRTDGVINANRLPIDKKYLSQCGVELIEVSVEEDSQYHMKHQHKLLAQIIHSLKMIDDIGYRVNKGKLIKKEKINKIENKREQLRQLLNNPFLYKEKESRIKRLIDEILGISGVDKFKPKRPIKVIILGAGKGTRLKSDIPKIIYPINGKANLAYLLEKYYKIDEKPIVVVNENDIKKLEGWSENYPSYNAKVIITKDLRGTAMSFFDVLKKEFSDFDGDIFLSWGDITNIRSETINLTCAIHQALESSVITIPTCWEKNPYAGLIRDNDGKIIDVFITKENPGQKRDFGEHDASIFIFKSKEVLEALKQLVNDSGIEKGTISELNFLKLIPKLTSLEKEIVGIASADPKECAGFNTQEEVEMVEQYMKELNDEIQNSKESVLNLSFEEYNIRQHLSRLDEYLKKVYKGLSIDVDETITNEDNEVPNDIVELLVKLSNNNIPVGIMTVRQNNSLTEKLIHKIISHKNLKISSKSKFYIYPENASYCYRLDYGVSKKMYDEKMPQYVLETALKILRKNVLKLEDDYIVTDYKLHILPKNPNIQNGYVNKINSMFRIMNIPLAVNKSNSAQTSGSIVISKKEINKEFALTHFANANDLLVDEIVKIGDMGDLDSVDNSLLKGVGSFSVNEYDINNKEQVSITLAKGLQYKGVNGSRWLLNQIKFATDNV